MSKPDSWMPFYWSDFLVDTAHLNAEETGAYALLLGHSWMRGGSLPDDDLQLSRYARVSVKKFKVIREVIGSFFLIDAGKWTQKRLLAELEKATKRYGSKLDNGRKGGRPPNPKQTEEKPAGLASDTKTETDTKHNHNHNLQPQNPKSKAGGKPPRASATPLPDWVSPDQWASFLRHRSGIGKPVSGESAVRIIAKLALLRNDGFDANEVLEQTIEREWVGVFPIRDEYRQKHPKVSKLSASGQQTAENLRTWLDEEPRDGTHGP